MISKKKGRKRPVPQGRRETYCATQKVSKGDLERLKAGLEKTGSTSHLIGILDDIICEPSKFTVNKLPSRQRIVKVEEPVDKLEHTGIRSNILQNLK